MRAKFQGKIYDTEAPKTEKVLEYDFSYSGDFKFMWFGLYRTWQKTWFICGTGGPMTRFARPTMDKSWMSGKRIIPLSLDDLLDLLESLQDEIDIEPALEYPEVRSMIEEPV